MKKKHFETFRKHFVIVLNCTRIPHQLTINNQIDNLKV
jgi:hypothetical protein